MLITFVHENGRRYTVPVSQVVVMTDTQLPACVAYQQGGAIVAAHAADQNFGELCGDVGVRTQPAQIIQPAK